MNTTNHVDTLSGITGYVVNSEPWSCLLILHGVCYSFIRRICSCSLLHAIDFCSLVWQNILFHQRKPLLASVIMEIHFFKLRHFSDFILQNQPIFKILKFEVWYVCQKIRHVYQKIRSVGTPNWQNTKWWHLVIQSLWAPYKLPLFVEC